MDILKDLPSYDRENFSRFSQGSFRNCTARTYLKIKTDGSADDRAQVIVTDHQSLLLRELEREAARRKRISLKRGSNQPDLSGERKVPRTDSDDSLGSLD